MHPAVGEKGVGPVVAAAAAGSHIQPPFATRWGAETMGEALIGLSVESQPLRGLRIAVTRPAAQADDFLRGLRALGAEAVSHPTIRIQGPSDPEPLRQAVQSLDRFDWIVFTSANGVARFWHVLEAGGGAVGWPTQIRVAAIGPATAEALRGRGIEAEVMPEEYVAEAVANALIDLHELTGRKVLLPRAAEARKVLPERLRAAGAAVEEVVAYETGPDPEGIAELRNALDRGELDMVTFTSASTVREFVGQAGLDLGVARVAVIGPVTAAAARAAGLRVDVEAKDYTVDGMLVAIREYYAARGEAS